MRLSSQWDDPLLRHARVADVVHTSIEFSWWTSQVLQSNVVARLAHCAQLGAARYQIASANHCRKSHSQGAGFLSRFFVFHLHSTHPELGLKPYHAVILELAGLLHDVGHGPFSHAFESVFMPLANKRRGLTSEWKHETMSCNLISKFVKHIPGLDLSDCDVQRIMDAVNGETLQPQLWDGLDPILLAIVANKRHGGDVDKMDYLVRDAKLCGCKKLGVAVPKPQQLIQAARVVGGELCYKDDVVPLWKMFFQARYTMHDTVYQHPDTKSVELMIMDILLQYDEHLLARDPSNPRGIVEKYVHDVSNYLKLDDTILGVIRSAAAGGCPHLLRAQELLGAKDCGRRYPLCAEAHIPEHHFFKLPAGAKPRPAITAAQVVQHVPPALQLQEWDIYVHNVVVSMGGKAGRHPLLSMPLWSSDRGLYRLDEQQDPELAACTEKRLVRVFLRRLLPAPNASDVYRKALQVALQLALDAHGMQDVIVCDPPTVGHPTVGPPPGGPPTGGPPTVMPPTIGPPIVGPTVVEPPASKRARTDTGSGVGLGAGSGAGSGAGAGTGVARAEAAVASASPQSGTEEDEDGDGCVLTQFEERV